MEELNDIKEIDNKYSIDAEMVKEEIRAEEESKSKLAEDFEKGMGDLDNIDGMINRIHDVLETGNEEELHTVITESRSLINELSGSYGDIHSSTSNVSMESMMLSPYRVLTYVQEDFTDIIKNIIFKLKQFLMYIARNLKNVLEKIYWYAIDLPGDSKKLQDKIDEQGLSGKDFVNDAYGEKMVSWLKTNYPSLFFLTSMNISSNPGPSGLGKLILTMADTDIVIDIPELPDLSIGSAEKFSSEMINFYRTSSIDVSKQFFKNFEVIRSNILSIEGIDVNKYKDLDVFIYNVDPKFIYYIVMTINDDNYLRTLMGKVRIETFRAPQIRSLQLDPSDINVIMRGSPVQFIQVLLDEIIAGCPKTQKLIGKIPGKIKEVEGTLRDNVSLYDAKGAQGDIVKNLKVYSGFMKSLFRNYYRDVMMSKMTTYLFFYKFSSIAYGSLLGSKQS